MKYLQFPNQCVNILWFHPLLESRDLTRVRDWCTIYFNSGWIHIPRTGRQVWVLGFPKKSPSKHPQSLFKLVPTMTILGYQYLWNGAIRSKQWRTDHENREVSVPTSDTIKEFWGCKILPSESTLSLLSPQLVYMYDSYRLNTSGPPCP